jgi:hypothetical protein
MEALLRKVSVGVLVSRLGTLALVIAITVAVNDPEPWQPIELVVALAVLYAIADSVMADAAPFSPDALTELALSDEGIVLEVSDDGVGIDASSSQAVQAGHVGLALVRRRMEDAGGAFEIATRADGGTRSRAVLPRPQGACASGGVMGQAGGAVDPLTMRAIIARAPAARRRRA